MEAGDPGLREAEEGEANLVRRENWRKCSFMASETSQLKTLLFFDAEIISSPSRRLRAESLSIYEPFRIRVSQSAASSHQDENGSYHQNYDNYRDNRINPGHRGSSPAARGAGSRNRCDGSRRRTGR